MSHKFSLFQGVIIDGSIEKGVANLRVEAWPIDEDAVEPLDVGHSDRHGKFTLFLPDDLDVNRCIARFEFRVFDQNELILAEVREWRDRPEAEVLQFFVPETALESRLDSASGVIPKRYELYGRIIGLEESDAIVRVVCCVATDNTAEYDICCKTIGEAIVDPAGYYTVEFNGPLPAATAKDARVLLQVHGRDDRLLAGSHPINLKQCCAQVDIHIPDTGLSEYDALLHHLNRETDSETMARIGGRILEEIDNLAETIGVDHTRLTILQRSRKLEAETHVPASIFYALARQGLSTELVDLIDVPRSELHTTVAAAIGDSIVGKSILRELDSSLARLMECVVDRVLDDARTPTRSGGLGEILASVGASLDETRKVLERYQSRQGGITEFWESLETADGQTEAIDDELKSSLELAVNLGGVLGSDPLLIRRMLELRREGRWQTLEDLTSFNFDDWCDLLESLEDEPAAAPIASEGDDALEATETGLTLRSDYNGVVADGVARSVPKYLGDMADEQENIDEDLEYDPYAVFQPATDDETEAMETADPSWSEVRAGAILDTLEEAFPSAYIRREFLRTGGLSEAAQRLLERVPKHNFQRDSIRGRLSDEVQLSESLGPNDIESALVEIEAIERVSRVTHRADEVRTLVNTGMTSAHQIATTPRRQFCSNYGEALGGRAQAARVHAEAQQVASAATLTLLRLLQAMQSNPHVLGGEAALKDMSDLQTLFGRVGLCECEHCRSVYSPAAYLVDLLTYLDNKSLAVRGQPATTIQLGGIRLERPSPLQVLLARRPDIADLPLTCENTLTPLPYIDLVTELLEAQITSRSAAHDTGKVPADILKAVPQHVDRTAYEQLRQAVYPISLPFHEPLTVTRAYLTHLGVARRNLLKFFARGESSGEALLAEAFEMSPEEFAIVSQPPAQLWGHFGFAAEQVGGGSYLSKLERVPNFLSATGLRYLELIDLVSTRFVNSDDAIKLESPSSDCDPEAVRISGLDEQHLSRMARLIRLQRRLGLPFIDLDRVLYALQAQDIDLATLQKLLHARDLSKKLDRPLAELLVLWAPLDTFGKNNQFERLLQTRAVAWRTQDIDAFKLQDNRLELAHTADRLDDIAPALLAAFRMTNEELVLASGLHARLAGTTPRRNLAGLSAVYRVVMLARALKLRIEQLDGLLRLVPEDANPFRAADPAATARFVDIVNEVQDSGFTHEQLVYLYHPIASRRAFSGPTAAQARSVLTSIRQGLVDAVGETTRPAELSEDFLRAKLGLWLDAPLVKPAMKALDPRTRLAEEKRRQFFNRHLASIFPEPEAVATSLFSADGAPTRATATKSAAEAELAGTTPAPVASAADARADAAEQKWRANIDIVVTHLLPRLRSRQMRGAVIKTLSDTLATSSVSTERLLNRVMHSRRTAGQALIEDFFALLGTGLTGSYFANRELRGDPVITRTDAKLEFSWAGAEAAPGVPGKGFSVRWSGHFLPRSKASHTFFVNTDGSVRLSLTVDGVEQVLLNEVGSAGLVAEYVSTSVPLEPDRLYTINIEYRSKNAAARFTMQYGTSPDSKESIATPQLYPINGLATFEPVIMSYRRLHKASLLVTGFAMRDEHLEWLTGEPRYLELDTLPMEVGEGRGAVESFQRWCQLAALYALRKKLPTSATDLFATFRAATLADATTALVKATGWDEGVVKALLGDKGYAVDRAALTLPVSPGQMPFLLRLERAVDIQRRLGVAPETLFAWAAATPDADISAAIVQTVKARYDEKRWLEVAESLNNPLRMERREALVAYLLPRLRDRNIKSRSQLFEYFLIDVEMNPCMLTSRVKQAISAVQTFFQRCLMNLEPNVLPRSIAQEDWQWMKNYRVWEANRKVFLYPENWIEPELRNDKSPEFKTLERTILQQEIKKENVESAFIDYLQSLDEVSRLDVRAVWFESRKSKSRAPRWKQFTRVPPPGLAWDEGTYHIFARTFNAPHKWFYRRLEHGRVWTPWEKIEADIEGDHLVPVVFQNRMHLFWTVFREKNKPAPDMQKNAPPFKLGKDWEIGLAYSVYDRGRWMRKQLSSANVIDAVVIDIKFKSVSMTTKGVIQTKEESKGSEGSASLPMSAYMLQADAQSATSKLTIYLFRRALDSLTVASSIAAGEGLLSKTDVELIARFELVGCNGELAPVGLPPTMVRRGRRQVRRGRRQVPPGYVVDGPGFRFAGNAGPILTLASSRGGMVQVLGAVSPDSCGIRILPVTAPAAPAGPPIPGLNPFFFQDPVRSYFVRPVAHWIGPKEFVIPPRGVPRVGYLRFGPHRRIRPPKRGGRRESIEALTDEAVLDAELGLDHSARAEERAMHLEEIDEWECREDAAWHPDDAEASRPPRAHQRPPASRPRPRVVRAAAAYTPARRVHVQAHWEQRLRFTPFEHPQTCRFINTLKSGGINELLALSTTRSSSVAIDHTYVNGVWTKNRPTSFEKFYRPGPLADSNYPSLDVEFDHDNPYALYNWELFFHAPLQVAIRLAKDGRHEEAQRWFHFIFDPTTDATSPPPRRYWRFAPFHQNTVYDGARELMALLEYKGADPTIENRRKMVEDQITAWQEQPFNPHAIARLRIAAYQKAVVMKYIDNLIEWGDKLFRRDTLETIQEATQLYILAGNILGPHAERIPPMVETKPMTFRDVQSLGGANRFANWSIRFENTQVRRPFRVNARPDVATTTSLLNMATLYFCIPSNPDMEKKWDTVADRLYKIRNCMNIAGVVRKLPLFEPPIEPGMLVRAAAAGVDLSSVIASLNAPPPVYRFHFLVQRAVTLAEQLRSFGATTLRVLERRDAEQLAALHQSSETVLFEAIRDVHKTRVKQVEEEITGLALQREYVDMQMQHIFAQAQQLMNPQEAAKQESLTQAQVIAGVAEGIDLVSKVLYAIPEFQAGAAGGFSSPFTTVQLGGQMFGAISSAVAESMFKIMNKHETEAEMAEAQAEYQRRQVELMHQHDLLTKERERIQKEIAETQLKLEIINAELRRHETAVENSRKISELLRDKFTNEELYGWMLGQISTVYFQAYKVAFDTAKLAERALQFERGDSSVSYIEFSYWDSFKKGLLSGERLMVDIRRMESAFLEENIRALEVTRHVSLKEDVPTAFVELLATGHCQLEISEAMLDGDFPGHYFRRVKTVSMSMTGLMRTHANVNCTLTLLDNRIRTSANASGSYPQAQDSDDTRFVMNVVPVQSIATSQPNADSGMFMLRFDDDRYLPFEGAGAISRWRIELPQANNTIDLSELTDVVFSISYTAKNGGAPLEAVARAHRETLLTRGGLTPLPQIRFSLCHEMPEVWKKLGTGTPENYVDFTLPLTQKRLPGRFRNYELRFENVTIYAQTHSKIGEDALQLQLAPPKQKGAPITGWMRPWPTSQTLRAHIEIKGGIGTWTLTITVKDTKVYEVVDDIIVIFNVQAQ